MSVNLVYLKENTKALVLAISAILVDLLDLVQAS
jgi:hypothetical protein